MSSSIKIERFLPSGWDDVLVGRSLIKSGPGEIGANPGYIFVERHYIETSGNFIKSNYPWLRGLGVHLLGGGGGGSAADTTGAGECIVGEGGSAGVYGYRFLTEADLEEVPEVAPYVVGEGGEGAPGAPGTRTGSYGGETIFQHTSETDFFDMLSVGGGVGGHANVSSDIPRVQTSQTGASQGYNLDFYVQAQVPEPRFVISATVGYGGPGQNAPGPFGGKAGWGRLFTGAMTGIHAEGPGAGGGGANNPENSSTVRAGGNGRDGLIVLDLYR